MTATPPPSVAERIRTEQVELLFAQSWPAMFISAAVAGLLCVVLRDVTDRAVLLGWWTVIVGLAGVRLGLAAAFRRRRSDDDMPRWERRFVVTLVLTGVGWGVGGWLVMPADSLLHQAFVYFFLMGLVGGAAVSYSAHAVCVTLVVVSIMLPSTLWFAVQDNLLLRAMAFGAAVYIAAAYRATKTLSFFLRRSFQLAHELEIAHEAAQQLARTDDLTGTRNRRAFYELGELAFAQAVRYGQPCSVVMLDVDRFKSINDTWGHGAGDRVLQALADAVRSTARGTDIAGRIGGDEFAILLPQTTGRDAGVMAERLRRRVTGTVVRHHGAGIRFTSSLGVAECSKDCESLDELVAQADAALYQAKHAGGDRVTRGGSP